LKIGILSDTHDNLPMIAAAVGMFTAARVGFVLHAGDFVAPFTLDILNKLSCDWAGVFGNNDGEHAGLIEKSAGRITPPPSRMVMEGRRITVVHNPAVLTIAAEEADLVVYGHTHKPNISRAGGKLVVNPGECSGWMSGVATIATVDLAAMTAEIITIP